MSPPLLNVEQLDEAELVRVSTRITMTAFALLHSKANENSSNDAEILKEYIRMCPYVSPDSAAVKAALDGLAHVDAAGIHVPLVEPIGSADSSPSIESKNRLRTSPPLLNVEEVDEVELVRVSTRITMTAFALLHSKANENSSNDAEILKEYIRMCPYVSPDGAPVKAALVGLAHVDDAGIHVPLVEPIGSADSSPSTDSKKETRTFPGEPAITGRELKFLKISDSSRKTKRGFLSKIFTLFGYLIRTALLDFPLTLVFAAYFAAVWAHRVNDLYLEPQMKAMVWDNERRYAEVTYYQRECDADDQSTFDGAELFLPMNATANDAYQHQLIHGLTVFRSVLSDKTATDLRTYIRSKNFKLADKDSIFVIENKKRYSFGLGTEEPSVANAVMELASHARLKPALEKILGPNPALIEMTAITSTYGAKDQYWHDDVIPTASALQFGRAFGPSYSVFVQLQNTTKEMGATACCPGSHFCAKGNMEDYCDENGFQVVNDEGYWRTGDALLMNMNTYHRGAGHTLKGGEDRVMLILTFVPQPRTHAESRQMAHGITFSLRWDMWGHTLDDLAKAKTRMSQPWTTLRALGLYKQMDAKWGVDYVSGASMRIANGDNGFREDELPEFMENGLDPLPKFLYGEIDTETEGWHEFYLATVVKCEEVFKKANFVALGAYMLLQSLVLLVGLAVGGGSGSFRRFGRALVRLLITHAIVYGLYLACNNHVDHTQWARDIKAGRRYSSPYHTYEDEYHGPTVWPHRNDVLIETRYKTDALAMYNDYVMAHPGNREWKALLERTAPLHVAYSGLAPIFRTQLADYIVSSMESQNRRFLYQSQEPQWILMSRPDAVAYNDKQLRILSHPVVRHAHTAFEYLISDLKTGHLRDYSMTQKHLVVYLTAFKDKLIKPVVEKKSSPLTLARPRSVHESDDLASPNKTNMLVRSYVSKPSCNSRFLRRPVNLEVGVIPGEPSPGAWVIQGDVVEFRGKRPPKKLLRWYYGTVDSISSSGWFVVTDANGKSEYIQRASVRAYVPFAVGEKVEYSTGGKFRKCTITHVHEDGDHVDVAITKGGLKVRKVFKSSIRRFNRDRIVEQRKTQYY